jgi:purine nucleosidase
MALHHGDVEAITVVAGNVPLDQAVQNALYTVELAGSNVPVYAGLSGAAEHTAQHVHGLDGMGDIGLRVHGRTPADGDAVDVLVDRIREGGRTLVTLGPLTNVAAAFERAPDAAAKLDRLVMMGGTSDAVGNVSPVAEFNIWADPESAAAVFRSGAPITMVGWDISRKYAVFPPEDAAELHALGPLGAFSVDIQRTLIEFTREETQLEGYDLPDPIAMAVALDPSVATDVRRVHVEVETGGDFTRGQTVIDHRNTFGEPNADVVFEASRERFVALLRDALRG